MSRRRVLAVAVAVLLGALASSTAGAPAVAATGACQDPAGVTVVVDLTDLGGGVSAGCAGTGSMTGLQALQRAGFSVAGTQREGLAYVCRIDGRPAAAESLPIAGHAGYREQCVDTTPSGAYWAYWYAGPGGPWTYATSGPGGHTAIPGGFEGWRFELNRPQGRLVRPSYTFSSAGPAAPGGAAVPAATVAVVTEGGSPWPTAMALAGAIVLVAGGGVAAWRRSHPR